MSQEGGKQQNTAYGVFVQACWAQHKRQYPDELIHKEIEEFNKQCSVWWYNLTKQEQERFQEMADQYNARTQQALQTMLEMKQRKEARKERAEKKVKTVIVDGDRETPYDFEKVLLELGEVSDKLLQFVFQKIKKKV